MKEIIQANNTVEGMKMITLKREAWIKNVMRILFYTREAAEQAYERIQPYAWYNVAEERAFREFMNRKI